MIPTLLLNPKFFPTLMIALSVCAAVVCAINGDWRRVGYYVSSAGILTSVTY
jgi:hypothetical protein